MKIYHYVKYFFLIVITLTAKTVLMYGNLTASTASPNLPFHISMSDSINILGFDNL
jgi:hypothetical protein